jgi:5-methylcytosine-specific restriction endonuclease McrA
MDQDETHNDPANLRALCQRCHNAWDRPHRAINASITRHRKQGQNDLFATGGAA